MQEDERAKIVDRSSGSSSRQGTLEETVLPARFSIGRDRNLMMMMMMMTTMMMATITRSAVSDRD